MTTAPAGGSAKKTGRGEGGQGVLFFLFFFFSLLCSGQAAIGPEAMNQRQRRDEKGDEGRTTKASTKEREGPCGRAGGM